MTLVKRMYGRAEPHEYRGFRNDESGGVYNVAARTYYPRSSLTGIAIGDVKIPTPPTIHHGTGFDVF
jgi:hypothetical protein